MKVSKPENEEQVFQVMRDYAETKGYNLADSYIRYMAEYCYLTFESKGWNGVKYWPAVVKRWVLSNRQNNPSKGLKPVKPKGKTVRDRILEDKQDEI